MEYQSIEVRKLTPTIGAEVFGVDLGGQIGNQQFEEIHQALMENLVIFFRDQKMTAEQHKNFGARFGKLHIHPNAPKLIEGHPEILVIKADENSKRVAGEVWHSDVSCDEEPPMGSILRTGIDRASTRHDSHGGTSRGAVMLELFVQCRDIHAQGSIGGNGYHRITKNGPESPRHSCGG